VASTWEECEEVVAAAGANGVQLTFNHQRRFGVQFQMAKSLLRDGEIGSLKRLSSRRTEEDSKRVPGRSESKFAKSSIQYRVQRDDVEAARNDRHCELEATNTLDATELIFASWESPGAVAASICLWRSTTIRSNRWWRRENCCGWSDVKTEGLMARSISLTRLTVESNLDTDTGRHDGERAVTVD
jgi:hypothetical protein